MMKRLVLVGLIAACGGAGDDIDSGSDASMDQTTPDVKPQDVTTKDVVSQDVVSQDGGTDATVDASVDALADVAVDVIDSGVADVVEASTDAGGCTSNAECSTVDYCEKGTGNCGGTGTCTMRPSICPLIYFPVCGCDKMTYTNSCYAHRGGTSVAYTGACE